jgi:sugar phosphate isomerase/epimerase
VRTQQFGISTGLYLGQRLQRDHLLEIASFGLEAVEVVAAPGHVDVANPAVVADLQQWLAEARLTLHTIALPSGSEDREVEAALQVARRIPVKVLSLHVGTAKDAARRIERLAPAAKALDVAVAVDSRSESMSPIGSLAHFVENGVDAAVGVALDCATAYKAGLVDAIEMVSEHLVEVRIPVESTIDWPAVLTTLQKVGYEGPLVFDAGRGVPRDRLRRAQQTKRMIGKFKI